MTSGRGVTDAARTGDAAQAAAELAQLQSVLRRLEEIEPRLTAAGGGELDLLEQAAELVDEASRLLERLSRLTS